MNTISARLALTLSVSLSFFSSNISAQDWPMQGQDFTNQRYSSLDQINRENISQMTEIGFYPANAGGARQQSVPVMQAGVIYLSVPNNRVLALEMSTGKTLWSHEFEVDWQATSFCCGAVNRGVAVDDQHVYVGSLDAKLIALDKTTGEPHWEVAIAEPAEGYSITMAPLVVGDRVIVGPSGGEFGIRGFVDAYDSKTGDRLWRFWTIPSPEQGGWTGEWKTHTDQGESLNRDIEAEKAQQEQYADAWKTGGGPVWSTPAYDAEHNLLYVGVGNPSPNVDDSVRPGDNLYTNSIVALDAQTGEKRWHYQLVPHDRWDYDVSSPLVLHDVEKDGQNRHAVSHASKAGWVYTLDRITGELITRSAPFVPQENLFAQPTADGVYMAPGARGGANWASPTFSPKTQALYVLGMHLPMDFTLIPAPREAGKEWLGGQMIEREDEPGWGVVSAISTSTGEILWEHKTKQWLWAGGALATAGDIVIYPEPSGKLVALDQTSGEVVWSHEIKVHLNAAPITFLLNDKQFFVFSSNKGLHFYGLPDQDASSASTDQPVSEKE